MVLIVLRIDPSVYAKAINPAWPTGWRNHFRGRTGASLRRGGARCQNGTRGCPGNAGPLGRHRAFAHGEDRTRRTHAHVGDHPQDRTGVGLQFGRFDDGDGKPACGCPVVATAHGPLWRGACLADPAQAGSAVLQGRQAQRGGMGLAPIPRRQAKRAAPQARRREGLKPNGRDGKDGTGRSPKARRRIAPTRPRPAGHVAASSNTLPAS